MNDRNEKERQQILQDIEHLKGLIVSDPSAINLHNMGVYHSWLGKFEEAINYYQQAEALQDVHPSATDNKCRAYTSWAAQLINESLAAKPGEILDQNLKTAIELCEAACASIDPDILAAARYNRGISMYLLQDFSSGLNAFDEAERNCNDSQMQSKILNNKAIIKSALGYQDLASRDLNKSDDLFRGDDPDIHNNLGVVNARLSIESNSNLALDRALSHLEMALQLDEDHGDALYNKEKITKIELTTTPNTSVVSDKHNNNPTPAIQKLLDILERFELPVQLFSMIKRVEIEFERDHEDAKQDRPREFYNEWQHRIALDYAVIGEGILQLVLTPWIQGKWDYLSSQSKSQMSTTRRYGQFGEVLRDLHSKLPEKEGKTLVNRLLDVINGLSTFGPSGSVRQDSHFTREEEQTIPMPDQARSLILGRYTYPSARPGMVEVVYSLLDIKY